MVSAQHNKHEGAKVHAQGLAFISAISIAVILGLGFSIGHVEGQSVNGIELDSRINPNYASVASLMRLPGIGLSRAEAIISYREHILQTGQQELAFKNLEDFQKIKGIGPKTTQKIQAWVIFEQNNTGKPSEWKIGK